VYSYELE